ncbi:hypothetical protein IFR05_010740 [Cadophora sp. M221]|nr:hypothetical protein IFR05_010740 [Cadophora sp. M221]
MTRPLLRALQPAIQLNNFRRCICLWKTASTGLKLGRSVLDLHPASNNVYSDPASIQIGVWPYESEDKYGPVKYMSLEEFIMRHAERGKVLIPKVDNDQRPVPGFIHTPLSTYKGFKNLEKKARQNGTQQYTSEISKRSSALSQVHITLPASTSYTELSLLKMYGALLANRTVEVQVHRKIRKDLIPDPIQFAEMLAEHIHLRPDVLLPSMPKGIEMLIDPYTDLTKMSGWVFGKGRNITAKLYNAVRAAADQQVWLELEKHEGRYREWNSGAIMTEKRQQQTIRKGDRNKERNELISQRYPETVKTERIQRLAQKRLAKKGALKFIAKKVKEELGIVEDQPAGVKKVKKIYRKKKRGSAKRIARTQVPWYLRTTSSSQQQEARRGKA